MIEKTKPKKRSAGNPRRCRWRRSARDQRRLPHPVPPQHPVIAPLRQPQVRPPQRPRAPHQAAASVKQFSTSPGRAVRVREREAWPPCAGRRRTVGRRAAPPGSGSRAPPGPPCCCAMSPPLAAFSAGADGRASRGSPPRPPRMSPPRLQLLAALVLVPLLGTATLAGASCPGGWREVMLSADATDVDVRSGRHEHLAKGQHLCLPATDNVGGGATPATGCDVCHRRWCDGSAAKKDSVDLRTVPVGPRRVTFDTTDPSVWSSKCMAAVKETTAYSVPSAPLIDRVTAGRDALCVAFKAPKSPGHDCFDTKNELFQFQVRPVGRRGSGGAGLTGTPFGSSTSCGTRPQSGRPSTPTHSWGRVRTRTAASWSGPVFARCGTPTPRSCRRRRRRRRRALLRLILARNGRPSRRGGRERSKTTCRPRRTESTRCAPSQGLRRLLLGGPLSY